VHVFTSFGAMVGVGNLAGAIAHALATDVTAKINPMDD
jgi:hypothetical protein